MRFESSPPEVASPSLRKVGHVLRELPERVRKLAVTLVSVVEVPGAGECVETLRGFDGDGALCFYRHQAFVQPALKETVTAVRTFYGYWLCRTQREDFEERASSRRFDSGFVPTSTKELPR